MQNYFAKITSIYTRWTENRYSTSVHFAVFGLFALLAFTTVFNSVSELLVQSESSQVAIVSQAVQKMKIPPPERSTAGPRSGTEIIVGFESSAGESKRNEIAQTMLLTKRGEIPALGAQIFTVSEDDTPQEVIDRLTHEHKKNVRFAEVNSILAPEYVPNDPLWSTQWHIPKVGVDTAWDTTKGAEVTVAVLDTGVDCTHPDLAQNCLSGFNIPSNNTESSDLYGHGTKVAGVIVAVADNALGVAGASPLTRVLPVRVTNDAQGLASYSDIASGIVYAADKGAKVVNVSYAAYGSAAVTSAAEYLKGKGGVLTMSSGNAGTISTVKNDPNIIVVGATDMGDVRASWSSYGTPIDVVAPGLAISTTAVGGGFISMSGTSFSAPLTAAVASLVWSKVPSLSNAQLSNVLLGTALDKGVSGYDEQYGFGRVDASAALATAVSGNIPTITYQGNTASERLAITSYAVVSKTKSSGVVAWATNLPASGRVYYGQNTTALTQSVAVASSSVSHQATITGLDARKRYYYQVEAVDTSGTNVKSPVTEFRTRR